MNKRSKRKNKRQYENKNTIDKNKKNSLSIDFFVAANFGNISDY